MRPALKDSLFAVTGPTQFFATDSRIFGSENLEIFLFGQSFADCRPYGMEFTECDFFSSHIFAFFFFWCFSPVVVTTCFFVKQQCSNLYNKKTQSRYNQSLEKRLLVYNVLERSNIFRQEILTFFFSCSLTKKKLLPTDRLSIFFQNRVTANKQSIKAGLIAIIFSCILSSSSSSIASSGTDAKTGAGKILLTFSGFFAVNQVYSAFFSNHLLLVTLVLVAEVFCMVLQKISTRV